jgi:hypothetical protein
MVSADGALHTFASATGVEQSRTALDRAIGAVAFAGQGRALMTASLAKTVASTFDVVVSRYRLDPDELIKEACSRVTRDLTEPEWKQYVGDGLPYGRTCSPPR